MTTRGSGRRSARTRETASAGDCVNREEALELLGVKPQTLYCYVSRRFIRKAVDADGRPAGYLREDVERMMARSAARNGRGRAVVRRGEPVLSTSITEITADGPRYRSRRALDLAREGASFESVAEYLWTSEEHDEPLGWRADPAPAEVLQMLAVAARMCPEPHPLLLLEQSVRSLSIAEGSVGERIRSGGAPVVSARRMIRTMIGVLGFGGPEHCYLPLDQGEPMSRAAARAFGIAPNRANVRVIDALLVLTADHGLTPATFAARIAASGAADLHSCVGAALSVHNGSLVGRVCDRTAQLFAPPSDPDAVAARVRAMLDSGRQVPGFNPVLYPGGDPRAQHLLDLAGRLVHGRRAVRAMLAAVKRIERKLGAKPAIECALVASGRALGVPDRWVSALFTVGRSAGWVAHVLEQRLGGFLIQPQARFAAARGLERPPRLTSGIG